MRLGNGSRVRGDSHARFCESRGAQLPPATHRPPRDLAGAAAYSTLLGFKTRVMITLSLGSLIGRLKDQPGGSTGA